MLGAVENKVKSVKLLAFKLAATFSHLGIFAVFAASAAAHNNQEKVGGYSPVQWAYGAASSFSTEEAQLSELGNIGPAGISEMEMLRVEAERLFVEQKAQERVSKLRHTLDRKLLRPKVGDLVYFWRRWLGVKGKASISGKFRGPARISVMDPVVQWNQTTELEDTAHKVIWIIHGSQFLRCHPAQLRHASPRISRGVQKWHDSHYARKFGRFAEGNTSRRVRGHQHESATE